MIGNVAEASFHLGERKTAEIISRFTGDEAIAAGETMAMFHADLEMTREAFMMVAKNGEGPFSSELDASTEDSLVGG